MTTEASAVPNAVLRETIGSSTVYKVAYGRADQVGNPTIAQYGVGSLTAYVETDPVTGQATMLHTSSDIAALYVYDGLGSPVALLTDFNTTSFQYKYDPYGLPTLQTTNGGNGVGQNPYAFKSGIQDRNTGFVKYGQRWYNPTTGTWTQQDTLDTPLDITNANRYVFAGGDPINGSDPTGFKKVGKCYEALTVGLGAIVAAIVAQTIGSGVEYVGRGTLIIPGSLLLEASAVLSTYGAAEIVSAPFRC